MQTNLKLMFWEKNLLSKLAFSTQPPLPNGKDSFVDVFFYEPSVIRNLETRGLIETNHYKDAARITEAGRIALANNLETGILTHNFDTQNS